MVLDCNCVDSSNHDKAVFINGCIQETFEAVVEKRTLDKLSLDAEHPV